MAISKLYHSGLSIIKSGHDKPMVDIKITSNATRVRWHAINQPSRTTQSNLVTSVIRDQNKWRVFTWSISSFIESCYHQQLKQQYYNTLQPTLILEETNTLNTKVANLVNRLFILKRTGSLQIHNGSNKDPYLGYIYLYKDIVLSVKVIWTQLVPESILPLLAKVRLDWDEPSDSLTWQCCTRVARVSAIPSILSISPVITMLIENVSTDYPNRQHRHTPLWDVFRLDVVRAL